jgi:hypothetical protein
LVKSVITGDGDETGLFDQIQLEGNLGQLGFKSESNIEIM